MIDLKTGDMAPDFTIMTQNGQTVTRDGYKGRYLVLYFYPKDDTPGCTTEAIGFSEKKDAFAAAGADILGISRDTATKHDKFIAKHDLTITLGADEDGTVTDGYGVWVEKKMYGKTYMGIERATFLIDPDGTIADIWRKVRVKGHVDTVLETMTARAG